MKAMASLLPKNFRMLLEEAWRALSAHRLTLFSCIFLIVMGVVCVLHPWITPYPYDAIDLELGPTPPSWEHLFGTDELGRDLLSRVLYGGWISLTIGLAASAVCVIGGTLYGLLAGFYGGWIDAIMMRLIEILYAVPFTIFVILLMVVFSQFAQPVLLIFLAVGAVEWLPMARIVRSQVLVLKSQDFITAAQVIGQSTPRTLTRHFLPNMLGTIIIYATLTIPMVILLESFLSFLGLGVQPPQTSWGLLIKDGAQTLEEYPWLLLFPSLLFSLTLFSLNVIGDALRDSLDPRSSHVMSH